MQFADKVYSLVRRIPKGRITTYKEIGKAMKTRGQVYRAVGRALKANKQLVKVPCHRVVLSTGEIGGFSRGVKAKIKLLRKEGVEIKNNRIVDFKKKLFRF